MFTGLVETTVPALGLERREGAARLLLPAPAEELADPWRPTPGESIAVSGCCLTAAAVEPDGTLAFDLSPETLERTWFGGLEPGRLVNLERSLRVGDRLGGHLVSGHVDGLGRVLAVEPAGPEDRRVVFEAADPAFARYLVQKGSVCVDGISLTVVDPEGPRFSVAVIPETLRRTSLGSAAVGQPVHFEADQIGKWVERFAAPDPRTR